MKNFAILFLIIAFGNRLYSQTVSAMLSFEEQVFDFGEILEKNGKVSHTFVYKNTGLTPIVIEDIVSGCGCTGYDYSKEPVSPGKKGQITITYNPLYRPGFFSKEIVIYSNNRKNYNRIWVKGNVIPYDHPVEEDYPYNFGSGLHLNLKVLAFGKIASGEIRQIKLRYANDTDKPMTLNFTVDGHDKHITFIAPGKLSPKERGKMVFSYTMSKKIRGEILVNVYPIVNGEKLLQPLQAKIIGID
jgi:hypothetical protein